MRGLSHAFTGFLLYGTAAATFVFFLAARAFTALAFTFFLAAGTFTARALAFLLAARAFTALAFTFLLVVATTGTCVFAKHVANLEAGN